MAAEEHHRRSIRLRGYDYTREGAYFVTINTQDRKRVFGTIVNGRMALNDTGRMVQRVWNEIPAHYPGVDIDAFVVMPDHVHGIVCLGNISQARGPAPTGRMSLPDVVHRFKSLTTRRYIDGVAQHGWPRFDGKLWHRNYYEIIVRDEVAMANIRQYIDDNPAHWDVLRYGQPRFFLGNRSLLDLPRTAFLASRGISVAMASPVGAGPRARPLSRSDGIPHVRAVRAEQIAEGQARGPALTGADCVISGFLSPMERVVFDDCLDAQTPMIQVLARGLPHHFPPRVQRAIDSGRLLVMTPFPESETRFNAPRAAWCNQYLLHLADTVVVGQLSPDGMLACLLADLPNDKPVTVMEWNPGGRPPP